MDPRTTFIPIADAARRLGKSEGHLRRLCKDVWTSQGLARQERDGKARASWVVSLAADPMLAASPAPDVRTASADLTRHTAAARERALERLGILKDWSAFVTHAFALGFDRERATNSYLEKLVLDRNLRLSRSTLYNWERSYRADGLEGLIDGRQQAAPAEKRDAEDPFLAEVRRLYLSPRKPKLTVCHELAVHEAGRHVPPWRVHTYKSCQRMIARLPAATVLKARGGEEAYVNHAEPYLERDYTTLASNEIWCSDHHQFDVVVAVSERADSGSGELVRRHVRPWVTAFQDLRSRKIVGFSVYAHDPNSDSIIGTFRSAVLEHGVPTKLLIDNGKDFDAKVFTGRTKRERWQNRRVRVEVGDRGAGLFNALGIDWTNAQPYHGQSKPIERWFGWLEQRTVVWDTYCGNSTASKPHDLQLQLERGKAPTLEELADWFAELVKQFNAGHVHSGQGMDGRTPDAVYAECLHSKRTARAELLDVLTLRRVGPLRVGQNGVTVDGLRYGQFAPELATMLGKAVFVRLDERDVSRVQVYDEADRFVCLAAANQSVPANASRQVLREAIAQKRADRKLRLSYADRRVRMSDDLPERMVEAMAAKAAGGGSPVASPPASPASIQPIRSALEAQLPAIRRASEGTLRTAVGAEGMSPRDGGAWGSFSYTRQQRDDEAGFEPGPSLTELMAARKARGEE